MIKRILTAIDGSPDSFRAFEYGLKLAKLVSAKVEVLFVIDQRKTQIPFMYAGGAYDMTYERVYIPPDQELRKFYDRLKADLKEFSTRCINRCETLANEAAVEIHSTVTEGFPAEVIEEEAVSSDLLVIGQHGENSGTKKETVGSTTEELVRKSPRPILVCPAEYREPKRVLVPYDGSRAAENTLQFYTANLSEFIPELIFLCAECKGTMDEEYKNEVEYLQQHNTNVTLVKEEKDPIAAITEVTERDQPDLIMIGSHGRNKLFDYLLGSTTIHVIRKSTIPVLVLY